MSTTKVQVARINRLLKKHETGLALKTSSPRQHSNVGAYYVIDVSRNTVVDTNVNLDDYEKQIREEFTVSN